MGGVLARLGFRAYPPALSLRATSLRGNPLSSLFVIARKVS
jgi:hypothetical protein